jgi:1-acyl-sn-glycerol-3-phosphate acyltransferase
LVGQIPSGPKILVAHHHSQLDPVVVCSAIACTPVAKLDVRAWALVGSIAELCNTMFVRPDEAQSEAQVLTRIVRLLEQGASILAFPEGTAASRGGTLRLGVFDAARLLGLPVVPLSVRFAGSPMRWMGDDEFPPLELQPLDSTPRTVHVAVGPSLWSVDFPTSTDHARAAQTWLTRQGERARTRG